MASAGVPCATSHAKRSTSTCVFPVPAPPRISSGPPEWVTACPCALLIAGTLTG